MTISQRLRPRVLLSLLLYFCLIHCVVLFGQNIQEGSEEEDDTVEEEQQQIPIILDRDDIAYFFSQGIDELFEVLHYLFENSIRMPNDGEDEGGGGGEGSPPLNPLPDRLLHRGSGTTFTTRSKLALDLEQAHYLASILEDETEANFFRDIAVRIYQGVLENIPPSKNDTNLYFFTQEDYENDMIDLVYNKAWRPTLKEPELVESTGNTIPLINPVDSQSIKDQWKNGEGVVIVDDLLTTNALLQIQQLLRESTVWFEANVVDGAYVSAAYLDDGLYDKLLLQLAYEIHTSLQPIMEEGYALHDMWARKYDMPTTDTTGTSDQSSEQEKDEEEVKTFLIEAGDPLSSIHVHLWLSSPSLPTSSSSVDGSNDDSSGFTIYTAKPPQDWPWAMGRTGSEVMETIIRPSEFANVTVSFQLNRAVIFDAGLFHKKSSKSPYYQNRQGQTEEAVATDRYKHRRTELTLLYGNRSYGDDDEEEDSNDGDEL